MIERFENFLKKHCKNTAYKATTFIRYYIFQSNVFSIVLHKFISDDMEDCFHNHPFNWISFFVGSYMEELTNGHIKRRWFINYGGKTPHRVFGMHNRWTLVFLGPKTRKWAYFDKDGIRVGDEFE